MAIAATSGAWRSELRAMLWLAAPLAAANLLQMLVYSIDVIFVARLGEQALSASSLAVSLFGIMMWCFSGLTSACAPIIAAELGRRRHAVREVRRSVRMALWLALVCSLLGMAICLFGEGFMLLTGQEPVVSRRAGAFLAILLWAMPAAIIANVLRTFVAALGRPVFATLITLLSIVVNSVGNYAFVFGHFGAPQMGLDGSAVSSVLTSWIGVAAYAAAIATDRRLRRYRIFGNWWRPEWQRLRDLVRIGVPIALIILAEGGLFTSAAFLMGLIGEAQLAAHTIALQLGALAFQIPFGIGQAATIRVGYHFGAGNRHGIGTAGQAALLISMVYMAIPALLMLFAPSLLLSLYIDPYAPERAVLVGYAIVFLRIAAAFQLFDGAQAVLAGLLRGLQDTRIPMIMALTGYWIFGFGTSVALGFFTPLAGAGVWVGLATGLVVVSFLLATRWRGRGRLGLESASFAG